MAQRDIEYVAELDRVSVLLNPVRLQIMELAIDGTSGTEAARRLGLPRQMVNYHVLALEKAGFLVRVGEVRRRNMVERRVQATARSYVISPDILSTLSPARRRALDPATAEGLLALSARVQSEIGAALGDNASVSALSLSSRLSFSSSDRRDQFTRALGQAIVGLIRIYSDVPGTTGNDPERHTLVLGLYSLPHHSILSAREREPAHAPAPRRS